LYLADHQITKLVNLDNLINKDDFVSEKTGNPSYGLSSFGYDARLGKEFVLLRFRPGFNDNKLYYYKTPPVFDPSSESLKEGIDYSRVESSYFDINPGEFILAHTQETFNLPSTITGVVKDKSTYARLGIALQNTVLEAGWSGQITIEISNHGSRTIRLHAGMGIAQILFVYNSKPANNPYNGKYQNQKGVVLPK